MQIEDKSQLQWADYSHQSINPPQHLIRRYDDSKGSRFYYWIVDENIFTGAGITSVLGNVMPESPQVTTWKLSWGDRWKDVLNAASTYGTMMHTIFGEWLVRRFVPEELFIGASEHCRKWGKNGDMPKKDLLAFIKFCEDYKVEPLVLEGMLLSPPTNGKQYCQTIDLLCEMTIIEKTKRMVDEGFFVRGEKKGQPKITEVTDKTEKKIKALVDFKSNFFEKDKKSFFDSHCYQLMAAKKAVKYNFDIDVQEVYNFSPDSWRSEPTYTLKKWNIDNDDELLFGAYINLASLRGLFTPSGKKMVINKNAPIDPQTKSGDYEILGYTDYVKKYILEQ